jgi:DNA repair protein SbcC/Rad50
MLLEIIKRKKQAETDVDIMTKHVASLTKDIDDHADYVIKYQEKKRELDNAVSEERKQEMKVVEINKEIELINIQISEIEKKIVEKQEIKKRADYLKSLESWLSGKFLNLITFTEKNVMLKLRDEFSRLFADWFSVLVPETLSARLDEQFSPVIEQQGYELSYSYLSGGERTSVALAYRLALNQIINSMLSKIKTRNLIILDEPTDGFSDAQLDKMRDVLNQMKVQQLILVSHEAKIESFVENIIKLTKDNNITRIER